MGRTKRHWSRAAMRERAESLTREEREDMAMYLFSRAQWHLMWMRRELATIVLGFGVMGGLNLLGMMLDPGPQAARSFAVYGILVIGGVFAAASFVIRNPGAKHWLTAVGVAYMLMGLTGVLVFH